MLMIIAPSKTQEFDEIKYGEHSAPLLINDAISLVENLRKLCADKLGELLKTKEKLTELNQKRYKDFKVPFNLDNARQAILTFRGDVYSGIDTENYKEEDFSFAQKHLRILSGLYGILRPLDLIQPYRLEMATRFQTDRGKNLYEFWGALVTEILNEDFKGDPQPVLVNLSSVEYSKVVKFKDLKAEVISPSFREKKGESYKVVAVHSKRARGMMVDFIVKNRISDPEEMKKFDLDGYGFNSSLSDDKEWVFTRG